MQEGVSASGPPEVTVPGLPRHPTVTDALEHALARSVAQILAHDQAVRVGQDPEDLHQLRVAIRRLRSDLRTFGDFFDPDLTRRLRGELRWVADQTNQLRDLDVLRAWLEAQADRLPAEDEPAVDDLIDRCRSQAAAHRVVLLSALGSARYDDLVHDLVLLLVVPSNATDEEERRSRKRLDRQVRRRWDALDAKVRALRDDPSDDRLHQARIAAKRCRAAVEAVEPLEGRGMRRLAKSLASLQDTLGAAHDAAVIEAWLRESNDSSTAWVAGELAVVARLDGLAQAARWPDAWAKVQRRHTSR